MANGSGFGLVVSSILVYFSNHSYAAPGPDDFDLEACKSIRKLKDELPMYYEKALEEFGSATSKVDETLGKVRAAEALLERAEWVRMGESLKWVAERFLVIFQTCMRFKSMASRQPSLPEAARAGDKLAKNIVHRLAEPEILSVQTVGDAIGEFAKRLFSIDELIKNDAKQQAAASDLRNLLADSKRSLQKLKEAVDRARKDKSSIEAYQRQLDGALKKQCAWAFKTGVMD